MSSLTDCLRNSKNMKNKLDGYLGFAAKARNLLTGTDTCSMAMDKGKVKLLIIADDSSENTVDKMVSKAKWLKIPYRIYGKSEHLSHVTGKAGRNVFAITDDNFAKVILEQIDIEKKEVLG